LKDFASQTDKDRRPSQFAIRFANTVLILGAVVSILIIIITVHRIYFPSYSFNLENREYQKLYFKLIFIGIASAILFGFGLRLKDSLKVNLSLVISALGISIYALESYLVFSQPPLKKQQTAGKKAFPFDPRSYTEVLHDLKAGGVNAFPNILPFYFVHSNGLEGAAGRIYPLGEISNVTTIFPIEGGYYPIIETDERGFNNPKGLYGKGNVDIVLTGDSYTEGYSVHADENISAVLRKSGFNVINLAKAGNGPALEYATLREYAAQIKPKVVLWVYYVNDFYNLQNEMKPPLLRKYLTEDGFSQNLGSRQTEIDRALVEYANHKWEKFNNLPIIKFLKLTNFRSLIKLTRQPRPPLSPNPLFKKIMSKAKRLVSSWGGKLYFVYLPSLWRYQNNKEHALRKYVFRTITELDIPVLDAHKEVFGSHADPISLFPLRIGYHYNAEGYRLVAEAIARKLKEDGIIPSNADN